MGVQIRVNGNGSGEGFLVAPDGARTFPVPLGLKTDDGTTVTATIEASPNGAGLVLPAGTITITPTEADIPIVAAARSASRNDTVIRVHVGAAVTTFNLTAIGAPEVWFKGRFEARFATAGDYYNEHRGTSAGYTWTLEGEPDFVPADSVPATQAEAETKPVGRVIRFNNPIALRSHAAPVITQVVAIRGTTTAGPEEFAVGDPILGALVNLGPNTYFAGNKPNHTPPDPAPFEQHNDAREPLGLFELHVGTFFSGKSAVLDDRPKTTQDPSANPLPALSADELLQYGIGALSTFSTTRKAALLADYNALSVADRTGTVAGRNLAERIAHLGGSVSAGISPKGATLSAGWDHKEEFYGLVNAGLQFQPGLSPVTAYLAGYTSFNFFGKFFNFHSDELCAQIHGSVGAVVSAGVPPLPNGVWNAALRNGTFTVLTASQITPAAIDGILGGAPASGKLVATVTPSLTRLVVSQAVLANPGDPPASWTITSRGDTVVGELLPEASILARDLVFRILPPGDPRVALGTCEGTAPIPPPTQGFARVFYDGAAWKLLLNAGIGGGNGVTYRADPSGSTATLPTGCTPLDVEVLTPQINFGSVEQGLVAHREIVLVNRGAASVTVALPALAAPFGRPGATSVEIPAGAIGTLLVSFTAGAAGISGPTPIILAPTPVTANELDVTLIGTAIGLTTTDAVLVLDRSGSMAEPAFQGFRAVSKTDLRRDACQAFIDLLRAGDRIAMVRFDDTAQIHMPIETAGPPDPGRADATAALGDVNLLPGGGTSVGGGMTLGTTLLTGPSPSTRKAMLVLTDGVENTAPMIADVVLPASVQVYAVGLGLPQNINVGKLSAVTGNTGGYLLVTGEMDATNQFRLHKYFAQILSGISGDQIVVDPQASIEPGETHRIPFFLSEADAAFDAILITYQRILQLELEAPDGTRITRSDIAGYGGEFVDGRMARYYRVPLPVLTGDPARSLGRWHFIVRYPGDPKVPRLTARDQQPGGDAPGLVALRARSEFAKKIARLTDDPHLAAPYTVLVRARSSLSLLAEVVIADGLTILAQMTAFQRPFDGATLFADVTAPDGTTLLVPLASQGRGRFAARIDDRRRGTWHVVVRAAGATPGSFPIQREQTLTGAVADPVAGGGDLQPVLEALEDLKREEDRIEQLVRASNDALAQLLQALRHIFPRGFAWVPYLLAILIVLVLVLIIVIVLRH